jgi:hypothetical protein
MNELLNHDQGHQQRQAQKQALLDVRWGNL